MRRCWARPGRRLRSLPAPLVGRVEERRIARALGVDWDLVHAFWPGPARAAASAGLPTVYSLLGMPTPAKALESPPLVRDLGSAARVATVAGALSTPVEDIVRSLMPARWTVLPPGIRSSRFPLAPAPDGPPTLLFSASLSIRYKGLPVVLRAFALVLDERPDAQLVLSGEGSHEWALDGLDPATRARVSARLRTPGTGTLDDADALYSRATVMVLPSADEAFGLSVVESLATGCPVVVADHGGPSEIVGDAGVGSCVAVDDAAMVARAALDWIERAGDPEVRRRCRERAMRYDWLTEIGPLHERLYEAVCAGATDLPTAASR